MKKKIIISGINLFSGGTLSIYYDCLNEILEKNLNQNFDFTIFVHKKDLFNKYLDSFEVIEMPKSRNSWLYRLYYEYIYFNSYSKKNKIFLWLSLHDMTPFIQAEHLATYCHNPTPFYKATKQDFSFDKTLFLFSMFYKYLYRINIRRNDYVVVQQEWIKREFETMYSIDNVVVFSPDKTVKLAKNIEEIDLQSDPFIFFYPSFPRTFKNFEIICEAVHILNQKKELPNFKVVLTIDGSENKYSNYIVSKFSSERNIDFIGLQDRSEIFNIYNQVNCLIFPSKLETWGLPISEAKDYDLPMLVADLPYSKETVGNYEKVSFFNPTNTKELGELMEKMLNNELKYDANQYDYKDVIIDNWDNFFKLFK